MNTIQKETFRQQMERSAAVRANIKRYYIYVVLVLIVVAFSLLKLDQVTFFGRGHFLSPDSIINLLRSAVPILILSGAFTLLMISGYIDLSVGSAMSLTAVVFAWLILNGSSFLVAISVTLVLGLVMGALNGLLVMRLRITPVIATLVTLNLFKGIALLIVPDGTSAIKSTATQTMPGWINDFARKDVLLGLPWAFWVAILVIVLLTIVQRKTILGKYAAAIGGNRLAADFRASTRSKSYGCSTSSLDFSPPWPVWRAPATCPWATHSLAMAWNSTASSPSCWEARPFRAAKARSRRRWSARSSSSV